MWSIVWHALLHPKLKLVESEDSSQMCDGGIVDLPAANGRSFWRGNNFKCVTAIFDFRLMGGGEEPISGQWGGIFSNGGSMVDPM